MKDIVVTAITKKYDTPRGVTKYNPNWTYLMFVDDEDVEVPRPWQKQVIRGEANDRIFKILTHYSIDNWKRMIWVDGGVTMISDPDDVMQLMGNSKMLIQTHNRAQNALDDLNRCICADKVEYNAGVRAFKEYAELPERELNYNMYFEMGFFARVNEPEINDMMDSWWEEYTRLGIKRDQPPFARTVRPHLVKYYNGRETPFSKVGFHTEGQELDVIPMKSKVTYLTVLTDGTQVGPYIEDALISVPDDEWVCLLDADSMFMDSSDAYYIRQVIEAFPDTHLFGCMTNRQGLEYQVLEKNQFENMDMTYHQRTAQWIKEKHTVKVQNQAGEKKLLLTDIDCPPINLPVAGQFMLMPKWIITKFGIQEEISVREPERMLFFDWALGEQILKAGGKSRLIKGLYRYHLYRSIKGAGSITHLA
jgi:hypothetical protein